MIVFVLSFTVVLDICLIMIDRMLTFIDCSFFFFLRIWNALTDNYGNVMPVDWKSSHTRTLHLLTLNLSEKGVS